MKGKKILSWLLSVTMLISCLTVLVYAGEETEQTVYKASDAWYEPTGDADVTSNTYNNHTEWTWERKDSDKDWFAFAKYHTDKQAFGMTPPNVTGTDDRIAGKAWTTANGEWNHPAVGKGWMLPYMSTGHADYAVSKTFTAPRSGTVKLSTENGIIYGGSSNPGNASNRTAFIRITLNDYQIWPKNESGEGLRIPEDNGQKYEFDNLNTVTTKIQKGDKLRFVVYNGDSTAQYGKFVYWKPVVTYTGTQESSIVYNSLDTLKSNITAKSVNGDERWSWKVLRGDSNLTTFVDFKGVSSTAKMHLFAEPAKNDDGTYNYASRYSQDDAAAAATNALYSTNADNTSNTNSYSVMSEWWMRTNYTGNASSSVAKVFTVPESGVIRLSAIDGDGKNKIYGRKASVSAATSGANIFIKKMLANETITTDGISDMTDAIYNHQFTFTSGTADQAVSVDFEPITLHVNKGEKLWFVVNAEDTVSGNAKFVHWNPVVSYYSYDPFEISLNKDDISFTSGENTLSSFSEIVANGSVSVTANAELLNKSQLTDNVSARMAAVIYDGEGKVASYGLSDTLTFTSSSEKDQTFTVNNLAIPSTPENGYIKVFIIDGTDTLNPLNAIGNENIYTSKSFTETESGLHIKGKVSPKQAGEYVAAALYDSSDDIKYINQTVISADGSFDFAVPLTASEAQALTLKSNFDCALYSKDIPIYCSATGTADGLGTEASPVTFERAIELAEDGGTVVVVGTVVLTDDFTWKSSDKAITVKGKDQNAILNIEALLDFNINTDTTFENLKIECKVSDTDANTGYNRIWANGNHVIIKDSVTTTNVIRSLSGGGSKKDVASTNLEVYGGNYNTILGGTSSDGGSAKNVSGNCTLTVGGNVNSDLNAADWDNISRTAVIHGGGYGGTITGNCVLTLKGNAKAKYVYGGQNGQSTAVTTGKITVNVQGGDFMNVFAVLKDTDNNTTAEINMTGGKVEALMGAQEAVTGNITINALGGTVTRRIIGGCYNDLPTSNTQKYVIGATLVVIGKDLQGFTYTGASKGIYPSSRATANSDNEVSTVIFKDGTYSTFKSMLESYYHSDLGTFKYDYLVTCTTGGTITATDSTNITVTADTGNNVWINNAAFDGTTYTLQKGTTDIKFLASGETPVKGITKVEYDAKTDETEITVTYNLDTTNSSIVIAALYDKDNYNKLLKADFETVTAGSGTATLTLPYNIDGGSKYTLRVMIWDSVTAIKPLCRSFSKTFPSAD